MLPTAHMDRGVKAAVSVGRNAPLTSRVSFQYPNVSAAFAADRLWMMQTPYLRRNNTRDARREEVRDTENILLVGNEENVAVRSRLWCRNGRRRLL